MKKIIGITLFTTLFAALLFAQNGQSSKIRISVPDFEAKGDVSKSDVDIVKSIIRDKLIESQHFEIIERDEMNRIVREKELQQSGAVDQSEAQQIKSVNQLLLGTMGILYGKVIITMRLVDANTGKNIFSSTLYTDKEALTDDIQNLISEISANAMIFSQNVTIDDIKESISDDQYSKAQFQLSRYRDQNPNTTEEILKLKQKIISNLAEQYYDDARYSLKKRNFRDAKKRINNAIAVENKEEYIKYRSYILEEEENDAQELALEKMKRRKEIESIGEGYKSTSQKVYEYYKDISTSGLFLGASTGINVDRDYKFDDFKTWWGGDIIGLGTFSDAEKGVVSMHNTAYLGLNYRYDNYTEDDNQFVFQVYGSPLLSVSAKVGNLVLNLGLDAGGIIHCSKMYEHQTLLGLTGGGTVLVQMKYFERLGIFVGGKFDYEFYPKDRDFSFFTSRAMAGLVF